MKKILEAKNINKTYGKKSENKYIALKDVSFHMVEGEFIGIMGPSGSGKTTLLNILSTLDNPSSGEVIIDGTELSKMNEDELADFRSQKLGFIFQDFNLLENMTVFENISLPLSLQKVNVAEIKNRIQELSALLGIEDIVSKYPAEISGGQKQRAAIARALIHQPALILGDEPTGALDSKNAINLLETLQSLNEQQQVSIAMVTHDPKSASYCKRLLFIQDGVIRNELVRSGTQEAFYQEILKELSGTAPLK